LRKDGISESFDAKLFFVSVMSGTNHSTDGFRRITRLQGPVRVRLFGFMVVVVCGTAALVWISLTTWNQLDRLKKEHAAVSSESFYLGVTLRGNVRGLNDKLVQYGRSRDPVVRDDILRESAELKSWLATNQVHLAELSRLPLLKHMLVDDFNILTNVQVQFERYLTQATNFLQMTNQPPGAPVESSYQSVRAASSGLLGGCDDLVQAQREDFSDFLAETQITLADHQRLLKFTLGLIVALAGGLAFLAYRGMIAPLRVGLDQSKRIIARQEKLASLGVLASGVAHEIRNPLTAIKMRLFSLRRSVPEAAQSEDATIIGSEISRLERILKDFLRFARPSEPELKTVPAGEVMQGVYSLLKGQLERRAIQLNMDCEEAIWVHADPQQMQQVLINLVQNAAESIGRNGSILLRVKREETRFGRRSRDAAVLAVSDTGRGIPPEVETRLFDPFFTTKEGGTGLGLAVAARIIEKHGGLLRYETKVNRGTTFEVVLPEVQVHATKDTAH